MHTNIALILTKQSFPFAGFILLSEHIEVEMLDWISL